MEITVKQLPKSQASVHVELTPDDLKSDLASAVARISTVTAFQGFRPGKAPYDVVTKKVGETAIWEEALQSAVRRTFVQAVREHHLKTIGQPQVSVEKLAPGNPVIYTATVALLPEVRLPDFSGLKVKRTTKPVTEEEVAKSVEDLRKIIATEKPVERAAQTGDRVQLDVDVFLDKVPVDGGKSRNHPATLGDGNFVPGFEENVVGMTQGQTKEFKLKFPKSYHASHLAGKEAEFRVTVQKIAELVLPTLDDMFAKTVANLSSLDDLRKRLRTDLETERQKREEQDFEIQLLEEIVKHSTFGELPEVLIQNEIERMIGELKHDVQHRGMKFEDYLGSMKKDEATLRKEMNPAALNRVKTALAIRQIAETEGLGVTSDEIRKEIDVAKISTPPERHAEFETEEFREYIHTVLTNRKAINVIKSKQSVA